MSTERVPAGQGKMDKTPFETPMPDGWTWRDDPTDAQRSPADHNPPNWHMPVERHQTLEDIVNRAKERQALLERKKELQMKMQWCYRDAGVNHYQVCKPLVVEYLNLIKNDVKIDFDV